MNVYEFTTMTEDNFRLALHSFFAGNPAVNTIECIAEISKNATANIKKARKQTEIFDVADSITGMITKDNLKKLCNECSVSVNTFLKYVNYVKYYFVEVIDFISWDNIDLENYSGYYVGDCRKSGLGIYESVNGVYFYRLSKSFLFLPIYTVRLEFPNYNAFRNYNYEFKTVNISPHYLKKMMLPHLIEIMQVDDDIWFELLERYENFNFVEKAFNDLIADIASEIDFNITNTDIIHDCNAYYFEQIDNILCDLF